MPPKTKQSKASEFMKVTGCTDRALSEKILSTYKQNMNDAVEYYYDKYADQTPASRVSPADVEPQFDLYDEGNDRIEEQGITKFFGDANVDMEDVIVFIFSYEAKAAAMGVFTKEEWVRGMCALGVATAKEFGQNVKQIRDGYKLKTPAYNEFFKWVFLFYAGTKKSISGAEAGFLISLIAGGYPLAAQLSTYLQNNTEAKSDSIFKDTWNMMHLLLKNTDKDGTGYSDQDAWPLLIVNFMESVKK